MAQLFVLSGADVGRSYEVRAGDSIGRSGECAVVLKDLSVSRRHAHLEVDGGAWSVVDDGSRNGITLANTRQTRVELPDGQEFLLGEVLLRFRSAAPPPQAAPASRPPASAAVPLEGPPPTLSVPLAAPARAAAPDEELFLEAAEEIEIAGRTPEKPGAKEALAEQRARVLQYHRVEDSGSKLSTELSQLPAWARLTLWLLALALLAAVFWFAFSGAAFVRGKLGEAPGAEAPR